MKKLISTIVAVTFALGAAVPAHAFGSTSGCSDKFEQVSRFNPTDLSEYQQCVFEWSGQTHGTVGNYIWIQSMPGVFTYVAIQDIQGMSKADAKEYIVEQIIVTMVDTSLQQRIDDLTEERDQLLARIGTANDPESLLGMLSDIQAQINNAVDYIERIGRATTIEVRHYDGGGIGLFIDSTNADGTEWQSVIDLSLDTDTYDNTAPDAGDVPAGFLAIQPDYPIGTTFEAGGNTYIYTATGWEYYPNAVGTVAQGPVTPGSAVARYVDNYVANNPLGNAYIVIDGDTRTFSVGLTAADLDIINDAIDAAYEQGYEDGYSDGYDDGYADGFRDGVESVQ